MVRKEIHIPVGVVISRIVEFDGCPVVFVDVRCE